MKDMSKARRKPAARRERRGLTTIHVRIHPRMRAHNFWSIANARRVIGYEPEDNSQVVFAERIAEIAKG